MGQDEQQILQMLSDDLISAEEASKLLKALKTKTPAPSAYNADCTHDEALEGEIITPLSTSPPPELGRYRRLWLIPLLVAVGSILLSGIGLFFLYQAENTAFLGFLCLWPIFIAALFAAGILVLAQRSAWLYLNVEEQSGTRIRLAFPLPLGLVNWAVRIARPFVPGDQRTHLETAASLANVMGNSPDRAPIFIDVDAGRGAKVQIYIG